MTVAVAASPIPILQFFNNAGQPNVGGSVLTQVGGVNAATYQDSAGAVPLPNPIPLNSRGEISDATGHSQQLFLPVNTVYTFTIFDKAGNQIDQAQYVNAVQLASVDWTIIKYDQTLAEIAASVVPTNLNYLPGYLQRYGGDPTGVADSSAAWQSALNVSAQTNGNVAAFIQAGCAYKILTAAAVTGQISILGQGKSSKLQGDGIVATITSGNYSICDNFWMENLTAPWVVSRDPTNWGATIPASSLAQSNTQLGYQPTVNDPEYSTWVAAIPAVGTQNIGPVLLFQGAATDITVSRIFGRFFRVEIRDATWSTICDCEGRGGKGQWGVLEFDNWTNGVQRGIHNRIIRNRISYGSFCGGFFSANDHFDHWGNHYIRNGESGTKTIQTLGATFTASASGATSGTLTSAITNGAYTAVFEDASVRAVTVTGGTAMSWTGALAATFIETMSLYQTTLNPQCFHGHIHGNTCDENTHDGLDCDSTYPGTCNAAQTFHHIHGNKARNNGGNGMNSDGKYNTYDDNKLYQNYLQGIWGQASHSKYDGNDFFDNNQVRNATLHDLSVAFDYCSITNNKVWAGATQNNFGIYALGANTKISDNSSPDRSSTFFFGNPGQVLPMTSENIDKFSGARTRQSFIVVLANNGGTLQHVFYGDPALNNLGLSTKINNATSGGFTNTPTGTDATTAMAAGAKISTTDTYALILDTAAQNNTLQDMTCSVIADGTTSTTTVKAGAAFFSINVNGVTQFRLCLVFQNSGGAFALNTTNIPSGKSVTIQFSGYLS